MSSLINLRSQRAYEARLAHKIGRRGYSILISVSRLSAILSLVAFLLGSSRVSLFILSPTIICYILATWYKRHLSVLPVSGNDLNGRLSVDVLGLLKPKEALTTKSLWDDLSGHWQAGFMLNHLLLTKKQLAPYFEVSSEAELTEALQISTHLADKNNSKKIDLGFVVAGLILASSHIKQLLASLKSSPENVEAVVSWLSRGLAEEDNNKRINFGGIGRDWAFGYTPLLNRFGFNVSLSIVKYKSHFGALTKSSGVKAIEASFDNGAHAVALVGAVGIGKSSSVYALAQRLIEGQSSKKLAYHQIVSLSSVDIVSSAKKQGDLEQIMVSLANEASHAGHIILFLDDAEAFFYDAPGSFDASQILLSIIQSKTIPLIIALTPNGYERLRAKNPSLASLLTPVMLAEPPEPEVIKILEDTALNIESKSKVLISYDALIEAYTLSGRYDQDSSYPGKAISLLTQAVPYSNHSVITRDVIGQAVEKTRGVKVGSVAPAEASELLNLEELIHKRMINQAYAVSAVVKSLQRARAGVTNPKRPIGSFFFLGPTGVGKTELAKSLSATYFKSEDNLIRLDMTEYQQAEDVKRLLSDGQVESKSLIMAMRQQPFSVVLLDEIEKAHPNILNLLLQLLDEGQLTDVSGRPVSFKDSVVIATSNAGAGSIRERVERGEELETFKDDLIEELISTNEFKPELLNRFDEIVLFRPLNPSELAQVVNLMMNEINTTLKNQNITVSLSESAINKIVQEGYDPRLGARPMRRTLQKAVEDSVAQKILKGEAKPGDNLHLDVDDLSI